MLSSTVKRYMRDPVKPVLVYKKSGEILDKLKETKSATMNVFRFFYFLFNSFVKVELGYVFTINLFTIIENCTVK